MKVISFGDSHFPFSNFYKLKKLYSIIERENPDIIIHLGDLYDQYLFGRWDSDLNIIKPRDELERAQTNAESMWSTINKISDAKKFQLRGNHDLRLAKNALSAFPQVYHIIKDYNDKFFSFKNVTAMKSDRDFLEFEGVIYTHGWLGVSKQHARFFGKPVVHGHSHKAEIWFEESHKTEHKSLWTMSCGCLIRQTSVPFNYTPSKFTHIKHAVGIVENKFPRLIYL